MASLLKFLHRWLPIHDWDETPKPRWDQIAGDIDEVERRLHQLDMELATYRKDVDTWGSSISRRSSKSSKSSSD